jgi:hypothetical protein
MRPATKTQIGIDYENVNVVDFHSAASVNGHGLRPFDIVPIICSLFYLIGMAQSIGVPSPLLRNWCLNIWLCLKVPENEI